MPILMELLKESIAEEYNTAQQELFAAIRDNQALTNNPTAKKQFMLQAKKANSIQHIKTIAAKLAKEFK